MTDWAAVWRNYIQHSVYRRVLAEQKFSDDDYWQDYQVYDEVLRYSGYPGRVLERIMLLTVPGAAWVDIGAGTGALALPLARRAKKLVAVDPSAYHLSLLTAKAAGEEIAHIELVERRWDEVSPAELAGVDYALASYSLLDAEIVAFLRKMLACAARGVFVVFRAGAADPLRRFAMGNEDTVDYCCLYNILHEMGYCFNVEIFHRHYWLPLALVQRQYRFSARTPAEIEAYLTEAGRVTTAPEGKMVEFETQDALLYLLN